MISYEKYLNKNTDLLITQLPTWRSADLKFKYGHVRKSPAVGLPVYWE